jgi:drug/metabolite transporter (DMT)-like permease
VSRQHPNRQAYIAWIAVCVLWGTTYLGIRIALETIPPALVGGLRFTAAGTLMVALLVGRGEPVIRPMQWGGLALTGMLTICVGNGGVIWAEQWVPSGIAAVTVATIPFWMIGIETFARDGDPLSTRLVLGLVVGFGGILLLVWPDVASGGATGRQFLAGIVALQIACVGWALGSSLSRRQAVRENVMSAAAMQMLFGGLVMLAAATAQGEWSRLAFTPRTIAAELYLTVFGSIIGYSAYTYALRHLPTATVSLYAYANPVIAILLGALVAGEPFGARVVMASTMVLIGSALVQGKGDGGVTYRSFRAAAQSRRSLSDWGASDGDSNDPAAADQTHQEQHDRDHQQDPNKVTQRVATDHSQ